MSSGVDVQRRPKIWSYFSFNSAPRRRVSVSLPTSKNADREEDPYDPYEKKGRHRSGSAGLMNEFKAMNQGQRNRYLKAGGLLAFILIIFYFLAPSRAALGGQSHGDVASDPSVATEKCIRSYSSDKPLIQYALMIDAGSTGSRIHVYRFNNCGPTPELEKEFFEMTAKKEGGSGLSSYDTDAEGAARSLDPLMKVAMDNVPDKLKGCTPVAVKATAGLRKLGEEKSSKILAAVRKHLEDDFPFPVVSEEQGGVQVMEGKDEGVYAWITINYLLGKIGGPDKTPSAAILDLGGGSTQIVFEPTFKEAMPDKLEEGDHKYALSFGGREFELYQHSYLGYGLMEARNKLNALVLNKAYEKNVGPNKEWLNMPITNPCFIPGMSKDVKIELDENHPLGPQVSVTMTGPKTGSSQYCRKLAEDILEKTAECKLTPCAFRGVYQPSLAKTFAANDVYLVSYFYDRTQPLGMPSSFSLAELKDLTERVCKGKVDDNWDVFGMYPDALSELEDRPDHCLDLNFMIALLHTGYEMPIDRELNIAKKMGENELGWCLGASLPLLNKSSGWQCKIKEITK
ncbi:putative guanosine-diphosphatase [Pseudovirgaria hyperparasitica]|uniref:guanosine-diphosphatase n=1 Tax=Pseudovirgaria hyperparasitica TaxID=470096 RepID=A0A6A6WKQ0_9PEZI|nr:putative guanosine-diphosphatase [Pseudovirgaria hyperparasitica]KAF2762743.1 putative guanosine-diphosphatase [Pseudovirgaria hyperparasitica]